MRLLRRLLLLRRLRRKLMKRLLLRGLLKISVRLTPPLTPRLPPRVLGLHRTLVCCTPMGGVLLARQAVCAGLLPPLHRLLKRLPCGVRAVVNPFS